MPNNPHNDINSVRLGNAIKIVAPEIRALGDKPGQALDEFLEVHSRFSDQVYAYDRLLEESTVEQENRQDARSDLVESMFATWKLVATVGAETRARSQAQVTADREWLFIHGKPTSTSPGDHALLMMADNLVEKLTDGSELARHWPAANLEAISTRREAFSAAHAARTRADVRCSMALTALEPLRIEWYTSLAWLRDAVKNTTERQGVPNRWSSLFRYRKPRRKKAAEQPEPKPGPVERPESTS